jgi:hypothetical protein
MWELWTGGKTCVSAGCSRGSFTISKEQKDLCLVVLAQIHLQGRTFESVQDQGSSPFLRRLVRRLFVLTVVDHFFRVQKICPNDVVIRMRRAERHGAGRQVEDRGCLGCDVHGFLLSFGFLSPGLGSCSPDQDLKSEEWWMSRGESRNDKIRDFAVMSPFKVRVQTR